MFCRRLAVCACVGVRHYTRYSRIDKNRRIALYSIGPMLTKPTTLKPKNPLYLVGTTTKKARKNKRNKEGKRDRYEHKGKRADEK